MKKHFTARRNWKNNRQNAPVTAGEFAFEADFKVILLNSVIVIARVNYDVQVSPVNNQGTVINHFTLLCHFGESFHIQMKNVLSKFWFQQDILNNRSQSDLAFTCSA